MTIEEKVNDYVSSNGTSSTMEKERLYSLVSEVYQINKNSFIPADFCYNRTNERIAFEKHTHLFERTNEGTYLVLGEDYPYTDPVYYRKRGETSDSVAGVWNKGVYKAGAMSINTIKLRMNDMKDGVSITLKVLPVTVGIERKW